ncbi:MAG: hypothetical protein IKY83_01605, partial [Proteobacteria bacterium]|nr:hypothetical protein [Pseudomonadota bacterium]
YEYGYIIHRKSHRAFESRNRQTKRQEIIAAYRASDSGRVGGVFGARQIAAARRPYAAGIGRAPDFRFFSKKS